MRDFIQVLRRPLAQSSEGAPHALNHTAYSLPSSFKQVYQIHDPGPFHSGYSQSIHHKSPGVRFLMVWSNVNHFPVQQPAATNSMHLQSIHSPHWPYIPVFRFLWGPTRVRVRVFRYAVPLMSYVLIVILFVKQNIFILHCSNLTPCDKNKPYVK